jgi:RNA-directed DNA polymerase
MQPVTKHFKRWTGTKWRQVTEIKEPLRTALREENKRLYEVYEAELIKYDLADIPQAYRKNHDIRTNAKIHKENKTIIKFDFSQFYDNVDWSYIRPYIAQVHPDIDINEKTYKKCFIDKDTNGVYQGSPCSGVLAGLALIPFWRELKKALPNETFTQYSDDLIISNSEKTQNEIEKIIIRCLKISKRYFKLNTDKTTTQMDHFRSVTGVHLNRDNQMTPKRVDYRKYRSLLHGLSKSNDPVQFIENIGETSSHFLGKLSYLKSIDETGKITKIIAQSENQLEIIKQDMIEQMIAKMRSQTV